MRLTNIDNWLSNSPVLQGLSDEVVREVRSFTENQRDRIQELVKIGMALSAEKELDRLLEMIVSEARRFTNADGGALYIKTDDEKLEFMIIQNDSLDIRMGGTGEKISWPPVSLKGPDGVENHRNVSAHCALEGKHINISDVYHADFDFQGTRDFDATTGYRSQSMLLIPLRDHEDEVIGVLQLLNALDSKTGEVKGFDDHEIEDITSLASQAAIAITNVRLVEELETLLNAFLQSIAAAIDEKSPYTAGHVSRVAELTGLIAKEISRAEEKCFSDIVFSDDEMAELKMAAWMHDIGKVTTPEYVVDKATKLQTIFDRINLVEAKLLILKKEAEVKRLKEQLADQGGDYVPPDDVLNEYDELMEFLAQINIGGEFLSDEKIQRLNEAANYSYECWDKQMPLLTSDEIENLSIRKGTLNASEREVINNHVSLTSKMLEKLPFPKKLSRVPDYAAMHHEKLDGSGYPKGLKAEEIPIQSRILAIADVFEALTAADRPYKPGKRLSESIKILGFMVKDNHLDERICDLLVSSGIVQYYACRNLSERQRDDFEWKGEKVRVDCVRDKNECMQERR